MGSQEQEQEPVLSERLLNLSHQLTERNPTQNDFLNDVDYTEVLITEQRESRFKQVNCEENAADYTFFLQNRSVTRFL